MRNTFVKKRPVEKKAVSIYDLQNEIVEKFRIVNAFSKQAGNITILKLQQAAGKPAGRENVG